MTEAMKWNYPAELPVVEHREEILAAIEKHRVAVVVSDTGSGKTTQLPKMVAEALGETKGRIGCTQPRRIAAASVAKRVAEELRCPLGGFVGYQVRFDERLSHETKIKFMTDGILLAETQGDRRLKQYAALIIDEAHERSLNIDFLLGYLRQLLDERNDLKIVISSATLDAGAFAAFFATAEEPVPVIEAPGRMFPVSEIFYPPSGDEDLSQHVSRAVDSLQGLDPRGDVLVFLPGEREIRECAETLNGRQLRHTEVLPLFARLSLADQQRVFNPGPNRRIILATNVAETSLTIPRIACVIDSGIARVGRWSPSKGVQRLQIEPVSQASARQRKGRCGRVQDGICIRLYDEEELIDRPEFTDPEIRRSSLAGVILRMKSLGLPDIEDFPFLDPPSPKSISEGYRTLREIDALDRAKRLTEPGRRIARLPIDPRLGRMLIEAEHEGCLAAVVPIVAALEANDPRERPAEKQREADKAHSKWKDPDSDFISLLHLWRDVMPFRDGGRWKRNALRKFCGTMFLNARRVMEWSNVCEELVSLLEREWRKSLRAEVFLTGKDQAVAVPNYDSLHRALLAGVPRQFGLWDRENKAYRSAQGGFFAVFPGSGLFALPKRWEWVMAMELVETNRLWARRVARIDPQWVETVAPHLCRSRYGEAYWDPAQGAVYGKETVICGGLPIVTNRRIHYGRVDPEVAHHVFIRDGIIAGGLRRKCLFLDRLEEIREELSHAEEKLYRRGSLWSDEAVAQFFDQRVPQEIHTASAFHRWREQHEDQLMLSVADVVDVDFAELHLERFPDVLVHGEQEFPIYYLAEPGARDDGVTLGVHIDQLPTMPDWLPQWGVDGFLAERIEALMRELPKDFRRLCQPIAPTAETIAERWIGFEKDRSLAQAVSEAIKEISGGAIDPRMVNFDGLPPALKTKIWVCDDEGNELAFGDDLVELKQSLGNLLHDRFEQAANAGIVQTGLRDWTGDALPSSVPTPGGLAFPALVDEGETVGIRAFTSEEQAQQSHRAGGARLLTFAHSGPVAHLRKKFPLGLMAAIELPRLGEGGTSSDDLILLCAEGNANGPFPRSPEAFRQLADRSRGDWHLHASQIGQALDATIDLLPEIRTWISAHLKDRNHGPIARDLSQELQWLFRQRFAWRAGYQRLLDYPRRLQAIHQRLERIGSLPLVKDLEKLDRFRPLWNPWFSQWSNDPENPELWEIGWQLEDYRISQFAPSIPNSTKPSAKRIERMLEQLPTLP